MATAKKTGIVATVKDAITGLFSDDTKPKVSARKSATRKAAKKTTRSVKKAVKKVTTPVKKAARKATRSVKKAAAKKPAARKTAAKKTAAKKTAVKKATPKKSVAAKRSVPGTAMDRKLIALSEPYEVRDWCKSLGCSEAELRAAVAQVGRSAEKVRAYLKK